MGKSTSVEITKKAIEIVNEKIKSGQIKPTDQQQKDLANFDSVLNAARHLLWQAAITIKYGSTTANAVGNTHDDPSEIKTQDSAIDLNNNVVGQDIGTKTMRAIEKSMETRLISLQNKQSRQFLVVAGE